MKISDVLHYCGGGLLLLLGALASAGIHLPGVTIDPTTAILAGGAVFGIGHKADKALAGFLLPFAVAIALLTGGNGAYAADFKPIVKSPFAASVSDCTKTDCSGAFVGANLAGLGTSLDVLGSGVNQSLFGGGGLIGVQGEYQLWNGKYLAAFGAMGDYEININGPAISKNRMLGIAFVKLGVGLGGVFAAPVTTPGTFGADLQGAFLTPYATFGAVPFGRQGWTSGAGMAFALSPTWKLNLDYLRIAYKNGNTLDPGLPVTLQTANNDNIVFLSLSRKISN